MTAGDRDQIRSVLYAPALCTRCGTVLLSDVPIADPPWITPVFRARGGRCPRCRLPGVLPPWVHSLHPLAVQCLQEASGSQVTAMRAGLEQQLRRRRTTKQTQAFVQDFRGPWRPLALQFKSAPARHRRAQLTFLLWIIEHSG